MDKQSLKELQAGKNLERHLPGFLTELASNYYLFAGSSFAMQYYSFYEALADKEMELPKEAEALWAELNCLVRVNMLGGFDAVEREKSITAINRLKKELYKITKVVTTYADKLALYEYILNRLEPGFEDGVEDIDQDEAAREILKYIFMDNDNMMINIRIQQMLSQLPVRMSRGKFCDLLKNSLELYIEAESSTVDHFLYMIESSAGLYEADGMKELFPELQALSEAICQMDVQNVTKEQFEEQSARVQQATGLLQQATDVYMGMMEIVNSLYTCVLNVPYASGEVVKRVADFEAIIRVIVDNVEADKYANVPEELVQSFEKAEGVFEKYVDVIQMQRGLLEELDGTVDKQLQSMMLDKQMECLRQTPDPAGSSLFEENEETKETVTVDRAYIDRVIEAETEKFLKAIAAQPKALNRAMMAAVLSQLPVFFNSQNEVMDYVRGSLAGCYDVAERVACVRLMKQIME